MEPSLNPQPQPKSPWIPLVTACLATAIVVGGGVYLWTKNQSTAPMPKDQPVGSNPQIPQGVSDSVPSPETTPTIAPTTPSPSPTSEEIGQMMRDIDNAENTEPQPTFSTFMGNGFSFQYPSDLVADEKGLWTKEGDKLNRETTTPCDTCHIPMIEVKSETTDKTLAEYVLADFDLPGNDLNALKDAGSPAQTLKLGDNEITRVSLSDQFDVTGYYAQKGDRIVALKTHFSENDNQALKDMLATLKFE